MDHNGRNPTHKYLVYTHLGHVSSRSCRTPICERRLSTFPYGTVLTVIPQALPFLFSFLWQCFFMLGLRCKNFMLFSYRSFSKSVAELQLSSSDARAKGSHQRSQCERYADLFFVTYLSHFACSCSSAVTPHIFRVRPRGACRPCPKLRSKNGKRKAESAEILEVMKTLDDLKKIEIESL